MEHTENKVGTPPKKGFSFLSIPFCISILLLSYAGFGLRPVMTKLKQFATKHSIQPKKPLEEFEVSQLPSFQNGWEFTKGSILEAVGTDSFILTHLTRQDKNQKPRSGILFVTYYSDPTDKVPHSPDVCYRQGGAVVKQLKQIQVNIALKGQQPFYIPAKMVVFDMSNGMQQVVIFTYYVEGVFNSKRWKVRLKIGKPGNYYTYFSKIETTVAFRNDQELQKATELSKTLLAEAIVSLKKDYFPSTEDIKQP